jgi:multidrug efflux system outer membrane protein
MDDESGIGAAPPAARRGKRSAAGLVAVIAGLGLGACAGIAPTPVPVSALPIPAAWSAPASNSGNPAAGASTAAPAGTPTATPLALWWRRFNDPLLVELVDDALRANTSVRTAVAALAQSRALAEIQSAALLPALSASASVQRSRASGEYYNSFDAGFDASWEPDIFGGQRAALAAADATSRASVASLGDVQVSVAAEVALDYMLLRGLQARLDIAIANLASQEETLQIVEWRTQAGLSTALEVEQARTATEQTRAQIPLLQTSAAQAEHSLAVLTWRAPAALHQRLRTTVALPAPADDLVLAFPLDTLRQRPDVRAAEARLSAAAAQVTQADAARFPGFQLSGSLGLSALSAGALTNRASLVNSLLAGVTGSLFDGGAARAQLRAQQAALEQAAAAYDAALLTALKDVEDGLVALRNDRLRLQSLQRAAQSARSAALLASQRYGSGLIDFEVVLETQRTALTAQDSLASAAADLNTDHVRLYKALGGGWEATALDGGALPRGKATGAASL